jgi:integrase
MYLWRRGDLWWFRKANPIDLNPVLGREIRCSLYTEQRAVARRRGLAVLVALEEVYEVLRSERPLEPARSLLGRIVEDLRADCAKKNIEHHPASEWLEKSQAVLGDGPPVTRPDPGQPLTSLKTLEYLAREEGARSEDNRRAAKLLLDALAYRRQPGRPAATEGRRLLARFMSFAAAARVEERQGLGAVRAVIRDEVSRLGVGTTINQSVPFDPQALREIVASEVRTGVNNAGRDRWSDALLSNKIDEFLALKSNQDVTDKHKEDVVRRMQAFLDFVKDKPVRDVTRGNIKDYRDVLDQLPEFFESRLGTKDLREALERNAKRKVPYPPIGKTTVDLKWLGPVNRLFRWLVLEEKIEKNPCDGVRSEQEDGEAANSKRLPFKPDQISKLFAITSAASPKTALYWLPLLLLCTGARPNELAQLRSDDVKEFNGQPHLSVLCLPDDDDEKSEKAIDKAAEEKNQQKVKSAAGRRMIPLHPILIEAGFTRFVDERHEGVAKPLFRDLRPNRHGYWSAAITKRISRIIRSDLGITNRKYTTYSLRHNFIDACKAAGIDEEIRMKFMGHQLEGVHGVYGNPLVLPHESKLISEVSFAGVDFGRYRET